MFSVVIPTLWKSDKIFKLLTDLENCPLINDIVLINNTPEFTPDVENYSKVNLYTPKENLYVNPSWNLGVQLAKNELVCLINDDVNPPIDSLFNFVLQTGNLLGVFGVNPHSKHKSPHLSLGHTIGRDWGCIIFIKKSNYIPIPPQLKLWFGDDWIFKINFPSSYTIHLEVDADSSSSINSPNMHPITEQDKIEWTKLKYNQLWH